MKRRTLTVAVIAGAILSASALHAQPLRYWGKQPGAETGWIELAPGQYYEVAPGTVIPGWGRVSEAGDSHLILEQPVTEEDRRWEEGLVAPDVLRIRIPRQDLRHGLR